MSDITDISEIAGKFKKVSELREYSEKLFIKLKVATETIQKQQEEIAHLKKLLDGAVTAIVPHNIPHEQLICEMEIARLQKVVQDRPLSLEETKKFDTLLNDLIAIKKFQSEDKTNDEDHLVEYDETKLIELVKHGKSDK